MSTLTSNLPLPFLDPLEQLLPLQTSVSLSCWVFCGFIQIVSVLVYAHVAVKWKARFCVSGLAKEVLFFFISTRKVIFPQLHWKFLGWSCGRCLLAIVATYSDHISIKCFHNCTASTAHAVCGEVELRQILSPKSHRSSFPEMKNEFSECGSCFSSWKLSSVDIYTKQQKLISLSSSSPPSTAHLGMPAILPQ